jgi:Cu/Ag efflux pump CusA
MYYMRSKLPIFVALLSMSVFLTSPAYAVDSTSSSSAAAETTIAPSRTEKTPVLKDKITLEKKPTVDALKAQRDAAIEKFKAQREQFKTKIETIKDATKKEIVQKIDTKISTINQNRTSFMSSILEKLTSILSRISEKADAAKATGKDVTKLQAAIASAQNSISAAQAAVTAQAGKDYIIQIGTEATLKSNVGVTMKQFELDLRNTHKLIVDAKTTVVTAALELAKLRGESPASPAASASSTPVTVTPTAAQPSVTPTGGAQ